MNVPAILMIGNCVVDQVWQLEHFPAQDEELRSTQKTMVMGGNACNSAQVLSMLGNNVEIVSSLAQDALAQWLLQQLTALGIATGRCCQKAGFSTPESSIWLNRQNGSRTIVHYRDLPELSLNELQQIPVQAYQWIHFEGRNIETLKTCLAGLKGAACRVSLEIEKNRPGIEQLLPCVDTVIVSSAYLHSRAIEAEHCLENFSRINSALNIVCTLGADGLLAQDSHGKRIRLEAEPVNKVVDTVGAGDCFIAGLIHQMIKSQDFREALLFANKLAARKIQYQGLRIDDR